MSRTWHVELDRHDVLIAAGMPAESYLDTGNRGAFAGAAGATALHPDFSRQIWAEQGCAELVTEGETLASVRRALWAQAANLGHTTTADPALRLLAGGRILRPVIEGAVARFALPPESGVVKLISRVSVPAQLECDGRDHRRLGVAVARLLLDGGELQLGEERRGKGWHAPEAGWQWTDGAAELDCGGAASLEVTTLELVRYWSDADEVAERACSA